MNCPKCREPTLVVEYDGVELDHCASCGGTWFDAGELALLFAASGEAGESGASGTGEGHRRGEGTGTDAAGGYPQAGVAGDRPARSGAADAVAEWVAAEKIAALPDAESDEAPRRCPLCRKKMRKVNIGPSRRVLVDACPRGEGLWFDADEVAELARDLGRVTGELPHRVAAFLGESLGGTSTRRRKDDER
jgi:Zn-finger nucleic acid-binding protein